MPATQKKKRHYTTDKADVRKKADVQQPKILTKKTSVRIDNKRGNSNNTALGEDTVKLLPFMIIAAAVYILICFLMNDAKDDVGGVGVFIRNVFYGLFANVAMLIPFLIGSSAFMLKKDLETGYLKYRIIFSVVCLTLFSAAVHLFSAERGSGFSIAVMFEDGKNHIGGGAIGGTLTEVLVRCVGSIGTGIIIIPLSVIFSIFLLGFTPLDLAKVATEFTHGYRESRRHKINSHAREAKAKEKVRDDIQIIEKKSIPIEERATNKDNINKADKLNKAYMANREDKIYENERTEVAGITATADKSNKTDKAYKPDRADRVRKISRADKLDKKVEKVDKHKETTENLNAKMINTPVFIPEKSLFEFTTDTEVDGAKHNAPNNIADDIFDSITSDEDRIRIEVDRDIPELINPAPLQREDEPDIEFETSKVFNKYEDDLAKAEYKFPPISYLTKDTRRTNIDVSEELSATAAKLVETLDSFGVKTKVSMISRGPSITRYELTPNAGVKVRSIVNLVDDIALNLAASGVRIEVPIPGKAAVGVEVPNKTVSTVHLRTLLEEPQFVQAAGKITVALGMDVAGNPIYSDIAKMPHLLIAGATGMGKSVCINSIIASILYKAKPSEVKLILIDPKKVELNIYNGIPHLLVPVVSDPKQAAGSLHWAVNEMENRFKMIEERGVRDIKSYNDIVSKDPLAERLPQIVIVIDELADLMMTAPVDVEQSICRLAQKARAAGMHLIIGTQRPSVDVITGLIKANIPSRIAFTVASQIDSRTIIDTGGADKLIGRGDMLYLPVGASKPMRVQGAYVSEKDILNVTEFLKKQSCGEYNGHILSVIEQEAAKCDAKSTNLNKRGK